MAEKKKKKGWIIVVAIIAALAAVAGILYVNGVFDTSPKTKAQRDLNALEGQLSYKSQEDVEAALNQIVADGMLNISINSNPVFENGTAEGILGIENIKGNQYLIQVDIARDDTGEVVYSSGIIEPGYYIEKAALDKPMQKGTYPCTATFHAIEADSELEAGSAGAKILITVMA